MASAEEWRSGVLAIRLWGTEADFFKGLFLLLLNYVCIYVQVGAHECRGPQSSGEAVGSLRAGVPGDYKLPDTDAGTRN